MICKMAKKGLVATGLGVGLLALLFGTAAPSYVKTAFHRVRDRAHHSVPVQFDIDRARQQVAELEPAIHQNIEEIAKAEVDLEQLDQEILVTRANLDKKGRELVALREHLNSGELRLAGGINYTPDEIKLALASGLDHYKAVKAILSDKENIRNMRQKALVAAREQNARMRDAQKKLMTEIEAIETRLKQIEATSAANDFNFDDSALARAKQTVSELRKRVEVKARVAEQEGRFTDRAVTIDLEPGRDILKEVDAEFGTPTAPTDRPASGKSL